MSISHIVLGKSFTTLIPNGLSEIYPKQLHQRSPTNTSFFDFKTDYGSKV